MGGDAGEKACEFVKKVGKMREGRSRPAKMCWVGGGRGSEKKDGVLENAGGKN